MREVDAVVNPLFRPYDTGIGIPMPNFTLAFQTHAEKWQRLKKNQVYRCRKG